MSKISLEEADVLLRIHTLCRETTPSAIGFVMEKMAKSYHEFKDRYPVGSQEYEWFMNLANDLNVCGVLLKNEILDEDLFFELTYPSNLWEKMEPIIKGIRKDYGMPFLWEGFEYAAKRHNQWLAKHKQTMRPIKT